MERQQHSADNRIPLHHNSAGSLSTTISGPASAWNIAFNDLKRRYLISQNDVGILKEEKARIAIELCRAYEQLDLFKKENEQLNLSLHGKNSSYNKLEDLYKEQRENFQKTEDYSKSLFSKLQRLGEERTSYESELRNVFDENVRLTNLNDKLRRERVQLEEELETWKNIPEVTVRKETTVNTTSADNKNKKVQDLISENKTLKTSLHWLSSELKKLKNEKYSFSTHTHNISGCLEEGINNFGLNANYPHDTKGMNLRTYIQMLHNIIKHLKSALSSHLVVSKKIVNSKYEKTIGSSQAYTPSLFNSTEAESCTRMKEPRKVIEIYKQHDKHDDLTALKESNAEKKEEHKKQYPNLWKMYESTNDATATTPGHIVNSENMNYVMQVNPRAYSAALANDTEDSQSGSVYQHIEARPTIPTQQYITTLLQQNGNVNAANSLGAQMTRSATANRESAISNNFNERCEQAVMSDLPPSLFHSVKQVQAQTYLTNNITHYPSDT